MKEHLDAAERQKSTGESIPAAGRLTFGEVTETYRQQLQASEVRPNTKAYRDAGIKLVFKSWEGVADLNVRRITSKTVEDWLRGFKANAKPHVPRGATSGARNSTGASATTIKCALDAVRQILDIAVASRHLYANPARNVSVSEAARRMVKTVRRERAERGTIRLPTRPDFLRLVEAIRRAGVADCRAAADYVQFVAFCGAHKNEATHVHWSDVDAVRGTIRMRVTKNWRTTDGPDDCGDAATRCPDESGTSRRGAG